MSNTPGSPGNLLELFLLLEVYKVSWKLPGSVRPFLVNVPDSSCMSAKLVASDEAVHRAVQTE